MRTAWWIAFRYLTTRRRQFSSFVTQISVLGLSLGVLVLTVVASVMNGFDAELKRRILGTVPHVLIEGVELDAVRSAGVLADPAVVDAFNFLVADGMVTARGNVNPVTVYGLDQTLGDGFRMVAEHMVAGDLGQLFTNDRGLVMGAPLAAYLGLAPGDSVALVVSNPGPAGVEPRILRYQLTGLFEVGAELDYGLVIIATASLPPLARAAVGVSGVRLELADPLAAPAFVDRLGGLPPGAVARSWADNYGELFQAVRLEKMLMFLILLMVVAVAAFNIVSGQSMAVSDKQPDIAILRTMGAHTGTILGAFLLQGVVISISGILVGLGLGVLVAEHIGAIASGAERWFGFRFLEGTYFVEIPSVVLGSDLAAIALLSGGLCLLSAWIPARRAAAANPLSGLHR